MASNVSRRDFLKGGGLAGITIAGVASLGVGSVLGTEEACAATATMTEFVYTCPVCGQHTSDYDALVKHFDGTHPGAAVPQAVALTINGTTFMAQVEPQWTLRETLLYAVGLTGNAKQMCDRGACGSCSVLIDGVPALSCSVLAVECEGRQIETSEGIAADPAYRPLFESYVKHDASQCGYCTPGHLTVAKYILTKY
ncbi:MAG: twin-arginine translocation signal domain-containing protein, partial [Coriobacteriaceae bacterium]|nr:twin-arginine translocation signal domain-containing protein [Coriobacteriaceae bacterium]